MTAITQTKDDKQKFANLLGPTDPKEDRDVREMLVTARIGMLLRASFFGNLATRLKLVNADEWCSTAATDGRHFYYNTRFIKMLRPKEIEFLFGHEVLHCVYDHFGRRGDRIHQLWNIANDYCVNADLKKHRVGEFITSVPCLYDSKFEDKSSEEIYDILYENAEKISIDDLLEKMLDSHLENNYTESDENDGRNGPSKLSEEERRRIRDELKEAMLSAAQTCDAGNLPMGVKRMIQQLTEPKLNWRDLIRMQLQSTIKSDYTWLKGSRKGWHTDAVMPGMRTNDAIDVAVFIDMSGSISDEQGRLFISEVASMMDSFDSYRLHIACFDTKVYNPQQYDSENVEDVANYELKGGGGTDFDCIFQYLKENDIEPKKLIVFTDGYPNGSWGDPNYCDTLWIIEGRSNPNPPFGVWATFDE